MLWNFRHDGVHLSSHYSRHRGRRTVSLNWANAEEEPESNNNKGVSVWIMFLLTKTTKAQQQNQAGNEFKHSPTEETSLLCEWHAQLNAPEK